MDFMNLNQAAHGDREFGFICSRLRLNRKVVVGHWEDEDVHARLDVWMRAACAWADSQRLKLARFGDNMREVAVTEGDKVAAQRQFGYAVNGYGVGDLVASDRPGDRRRGRPAASKEYAELYEVKVSKEQMAAVRGQARIEIGLRAFLEEGGFSAFTDTFEDLHGLEQLPGLAVQRLMAEGYGFGAEGDWKTAALVRALKVMATGLPARHLVHGGLHLPPRPEGAKVLGAHMLEVCPTIATLASPRSRSTRSASAARPTPPASSSHAAPGPAVNAAVIDLGNRFRLVVNEVDVVDPDAPLPKLPVARALWVPRPDLKVAAAAWIHAGSSHHTAFSLAVGPEHLRDFADMAGVEFVLIDEHTRLARDPEGAALERGLLPAREGVLSDEPAESRPRLDVWL